MCPAKRYEEPGMLTFYTDGASGNKAGKPIGWAYVKLYKSKKMGGKTFKVVFGSRAEGTNNIAEMMAAIEALESVKKPSKIKLITDSKVLKVGITEWIHNWKRRNWRSASGEKVKNKKLWLRLEEAAAPHTIEWVHMRGHGKGNESPTEKYWNAMADSFAVLAKDQQIKGSRRAELVDADIRV